MDESDAACEPVLRKAYAAFHAGVHDGAPPGRAFKVIAATNWKGLVPEDFPLDAWVHLYQEYDDAAAKAWLHSGPSKEYWGYHCIEPAGEEYLNTFIERPLIEERLLFWLAASRRYQGWLYWADNLWRSCPQAPWPSPPKHVLSFANATHPALTNFDPANYIWCKDPDRLYDIFANGDGYFVYPGPAGPIPSVRLEAIRDGLEDWELFEMVKSPLSEDDGPARVRELVGEAVSSPTEWVDDSTLLRRLRAGLLAALPAVAVQERVEVQVS